VNSPNEVIWVQLDTVHAIHEAQVEEHGGGVGVRHTGLLESALARPQQHATYADPPSDLPTLAAIYGIAFVRNHPFIDGNKRVGLVELATTDELATTWVLWR
jgi:death-on-curing protein